MTFLIVLAIYFIPSIVAANKKNGAAILMLNLLLGWTVIGWVVALVWAMSSEKIATPVVVVPAAAPGLPVARLCASCGKYSAPDTRFCGSCGVHA